MKSGQVQKLTRLAMLLALGVLLNYTEAILLPTAFIAPGVKLGLANTVGLIVLYLYDDKTYVFYGFTRVIMTRGRSNHDGSVVVSIHLHDQLFAYFNRLEFNGRFDHR